jgi:sulfide:quinone oxidoreductase
MTPSSNVLLTVGVRTLQDTEPKPLAPIGLSKELFVGRSPTPEELAVLAGAGFRSIINNRPDGETGSPMTSAETAAAAAEQGLANRHIPVEGRNPLERDVRAFAQALATLPRPIYACCHSGGRSAALWALASVTELTTDELIRICREAGFDLSWLAPKMDMRREQLQDDSNDERSG